MADAATGRRHRLSPSLIRLLVDHGDVPVTAAELARAGRVPAAVVDRLADAGLLVPAVPGDPSGPRWTTPELYAQRLANTGGKVATHGRPPVGDRRAPAQPATGFDWLRHARGRSVRQFAHEPVAADLMRTIISTAAARFPTADGGSARPYASGGNLYPIQMYVHADRVIGLEPRLYRYEPDRDELHPMAGDGVPVRDHVLAALGTHTPPAATIVLTGLFTEILEDYEHIGVALIHKEAGGLLQLLAMASNAAGLGGCVVGTVPERLVEDVLGVDPLIESGLAAYALGRIG